MAPVSEVLNSPEIDTPTGSQLPEKDTVPALTDEPKVAEPAEEPFVIPPSQHRTDATTVSRAKVVECLGRLRSVAHGANISPAFYEELRRVFKELHLGPLPAKPMDMKAHNIPERTKNTTAITTAPCEPDDLEPEEVITLSLLPA